jgi:hypothetical protein
MVIDDEPPPRRWPWIAVGFEGNHDAMWVCCGPSSPSFGGVLVCDDAYPWYDDERADHASLADCFEDIARR